MMKLRRSGGDDEAFYTNAPEANNDMFNLELEFPVTSYQPLIAVPFLF